MHSWRTLPSGQTEVDGEVPSLAPSEADALRRMIDRDGGLIAEVSNRTGAPRERVAAHEWIESGGVYPTPRGSSGEYGPMQIMPFHFDGRHGIPATPEALRAEITTNLDMGARIVGEIARIGADAPTAASIYNAGGSVAAPHRDPASEWGLHATGNYIDRFVRATNFLLSSPTIQARISARSSDPTTVLVAGDSIAAGVGPYVARALPMARVTTRGVTGARLEAIDRALEGAIASVGAPVDVIVIVGGANDEGYPDVTKGRADYWSLALHAAERARDGVVLVAPPPNANPAAASYAWRAQDFAAWSIECAAQLRKNRFRAVAADGDLTHADMDPAGSPPGVHPIPRGYAKMADAIARGVSQVVSAGGAPSRSSVGGVVVLVAGFALGRYLLKWW